jgi:hypothetical protein
MPKSFLSCLCKPSKLSFFGQSHDLLTSATPTFFSHMTCLCQPSKFPFWDFFFGILKKILYKQPTPLGHPHCRHLPNWEHQCPVSWVPASPIKLLEILWAKSPPQGNKKLMRKKTTNYDIVSQIFKESNKDYWPEHSCMWRDDLSVQPMVWFQLWHRLRPDSSTIFPSLVRVHRVSCLPFQRAVARQ